ncbi:MAG: dockerin type I domain-containing protein [Phycisphaerales bacterium]
MSHAPLHPDDPNAPESLAADLRRLAGRPASLPMFDARSAAAAHFARRRAGRLRVALAGVGALAAGLAFAAWVWPPEVGPRVSPVALRGDLNSDGRVDILDAYMLARAEADGAANPDWDFSGDGRVDRADVDLVAGIAVRVAPSGGKL